MVSLIALNDTHLRDCNHCCITVAGNQHGLYDYRESIRGARKTRETIDVRIKVRWNRLFDRVPEIAPRWIYIGSRLNFLEQFTSADLSIVSNRS